MDNRLRMAKAEILEDARRYTNRVRQEHKMIVAARNTNPYDRGSTGRSEGEALALAEMARLGERILEAASYRKDQLLVMGIASDEAKVAMKDAYPLIEDYLWEDKIFMQAFDLLYSSCREMGLNPERRVITKHNGKDIPPYYELIVKW